MRIGSDAAAVDETAQGNGARDLGRHTRAGSPNARKVAHLSVEERVARGKVARNEVPRSAHGRWEHSRNRPDPIGLLEEQAASRVRSWFLSATVGCWSHRSPSTAGLR